MEKIEEHGRIIFSCWFGIRSPGLMKEDGRDYPLPQRSMVVQLSQTTLTFPQGKFIAFVGEFYIYAINPSRLFFPLPLL